MEETHLGWRSGAARWWSSAAWARCPLPALRGEAVLCWSSTLPVPGTVTDRGRPRLAVLRLFSHRWSADAVQSGSVARMAAISFLSLLSPPPLFFPLAFTSRKEGPVLHLTITSPPPPTTTTTLLPSTAACLPGCAVRWRELVPVWSECVNAVRSGTSHSAPASALMLSVS